MIDVVFLDESDAGVRLIPLIFDAVPEEQHRATAIATEDQVEEGAAVTDHVRPERQVLTFKAVISDTPIASNDAIGVELRPAELQIPGAPAIATAASFDGGRWSAATLEEGAGRLVKIAILEPTGEVTRVDDALAVIEDARQRSILAIVTTRFRTYENMALVEFVADRTAGDGTWLRGSFVFKEIGFQSVELVDDPVPLRPRDRVEEQKGAQETTPAPERLRSGLSRLFG